MSKFEDFKWQTHIDIVGRPGYYHHCDPFTILTREVRDGERQENPVVYFSNEVFLTGLFPAQVMTLLDECFKTGQENFERWKSNPTGEYRPYRGHAPAMQAVFTLIVIMFGILVGSTIGAVWLDFGPFQSIMIGVLSLLIVMGLVGVYFHIEMRILDKKFARRFIQIMNDYPHLKNQKEEVLSVLHKVAKLKQKPNYSSPAVFSRGAKKVIRLIR